MLEKWKEVEEEENHTMESMKQHTTLEQLNKMTNSGGGKWRKRIHDITKSRCRLNETRC